MEKYHRSIMKQREVSSKPGYAKHFIANSWFTIAEKNHELASKNHPSLIIQLLIVRWVLS